MTKTKCPICNKCAIFGFAKSDKQLYCKLHALEGMINVISKRCTDPDCMTRPTFNTPRIN